MRAKSLILIFIALGCGLVASIGITQVIKSDQGDSKDEPVASVLVAVAPIDINEEFTPENVGIEQWPINRIPPGAISKIEDLVDRFPRQRLYEGEPILEAKLMGSEQADETKNIPASYRVVSMKVTVDTVAGGLIQPGDRVDVIAFLKRGPEVAQAMTKTVLKDVRVFAVDQKVERKLDDDGTSSKMKTVSLLIQKKQVPMLMLAIELGRLRLSLRRPDENDELGEDGDDVDDATMESLLGGEPGDGDDSNNPTSGNDGPSNGLLDILGGGGPAMAGIGVAAPVVPERKKDWQITVFGPDGTTRYTWYDGEDLPTEEAVGGYVPQPIPADADSAQPEESDQTEEEVDSEPQD